MAYCCPSVWFCSATVHGGCRDNHALNPFVEDSTCVKVCETSGFDSREDMYRCHCRVLL